LEVLRDDLDYFVPEPQIMNAKDFGVPQNRERIFIVGFRNDLKITKFDYPKPIEEQKTFSDIKEKLVVPTKYYISETYQKTLLSHKQRHANKGNGFGFELIADNQCANAIVVGGMGRERNIVIDNRLIDFIPTTHIRSAVVVSDAQAYKQFGNSVAIPAIQATAKVLVEKVVQFSKKTGKQPIKQS